MTVVAVVDFETTGIGPDDEPVSVGVIAVRVDERGGILEDLGRYEGLREPSVPIHPRAQAVHGMSMADLQGHQFDEPALRALLERADVLVAHNAAFDARMLSVIMSVQTPWRCSYRQFPWGTLQNRKLDTVCGALGVERPAIHGAMRDAESLLACLLKRTGKTDRSRTYLQTLLNKPAFDVAAPQWTSTPYSGASKGGGAKSRSTTSWPYVLGKVVATVCLAVVALLVAIFGAVLQIGGEKRRK